ncbi:hypothetical protein FHS87_004535 [Roseomonas pecuniae]|uniref:DUF6895 domain-containing protein n=1 Tax=Muricoccus pecuniae TaxID=693023 RepID=A0A840YND6_9PROT|nr:hypothetical protein [Roseomonas pecuniae]MBB5696464.1 hypothetical protein [Roseomonas pecuniae]
MVAFKPIGELVLVSEKMLRTERDELWLKLLEWAWSEFERGDMILRVLTARPDLVVLSTIYASFARSGYTDNRLAGWLSYLEKTTSCSALEFPRWRKLDVEHAFASLNAVMLPKDCLNGTWFAAMPEPWLMTDDLAYATTHAVFYATDFGRYSDALPRRLHEYLGLWLPIWLQLSLEKENFDLYAEWLMVAAYSGHYAIYDEHSTQLLAHQRGDGAFPGPHDCEKDPESSSRISDFLTNYHTTLVSLLALQAQCLCNDPSAFGSEMGVLHR